VVKANLPSNQTDEKSHLSDLRYLGGNQWQDVAETVNNTDQAGSTTNSSIKPWHQGLVLNGTTAQDYSSQWQSWLIALCAIAAPF